MTRVFVLAMLALMAAPGIAQADGGESTFGRDRVLWLASYDSGDRRLSLLATTWATGVLETMSIVTFAAGCTSQVAVSPATLASATADLLRARADALPLASAITAYGRMSGCDEAVMDVMKRRETNTRR